MTVLSGDEVRRIFEAYGHAVELQRKADDAREVGTLQGLVDALVYELSVVSGMVSRTSHLDEGYHGSGDVTLNVEAEVSESGEDALFFATTVDGYEVDVTEVVWKLAHTDAEDIVDAVMQDVDWQEKRYGDVDFRIKREREEAHG